MKELTSLFFGGVIVILAIGIAVPLARYAMIRRTQVGTTESPVEKLGGDFELFADAALTSQLTHIDWGNITVGDSVTYPLFIKSSENLSVYTIQTYNWTPPEAENFLELSWDYNNETKSNNEVFQINLNLFVSPTLTKAENITRFDFNIVISSVDVYEELEEKSDG